MHAHRAALEGPRRSQALDVPGVDLVKRAEALPVVGAVVGEPVVRFLLAGVENALVRDVLCHRRRTPDHGAESLEVDGLACVYVFSLSCHQCSLLRSWLGWAVETGLLRDIPPYDDRAGQAAAFIVSCPGAVPVIARAVEVQPRRS